MRRFNLCWWGVIALLALPQSVDAATRYNVDVATDRKDGIFKLGEEVVFRINVRENGKPPVAKQVAYTITKDDGSQVAGGSVPITAKPVLVKAKLDEPGFLKCAVTYSAGNMTIHEGGAAAVAPEQFKPTVPPPDDFDAFWQAQRQLLASKPAEATTKPAQTKEAAVIVIDVQAPTLDGLAPMHGYLARPKNARDKSLPAILLPQSMLRAPIGRPGAAPQTPLGVHDSDMNRAVQAAKTGMIALSFNLHGVPNAQGFKAYEELARGDLKDVLTTGAADRETHFLRGAILRELRALELLTQQPQWNGRVLIVQGENVGGGLALAAAALDQRVTLCVAEVPAMCDLAAATPGRAGWPQVQPAGDEKIKQAARYFDAANFATRIKCPVVMTVSFINNNAPPAGVYAAYASLPAEVQKQMFRADGGLQPKQIDAQINGIIRKQITAAAAPPPAPAASPR